MGGLLGGVRGGGGQRVCWSPSQIIGGVGPSPLPPPLFLRLWGVLLFWMIVGQGPIALAVSAGGVLWIFFFLFYLSSFLSVVSGRRSDVD